MIIPGSVVSTGIGLFRNCTHLASIAIPANITNLADFEFYGCVGLTNVSIASGATRIGSEVFLGCSNLTRIMIPASVTNLAPDAFDNCPNLISVFFQGNAPALTSTTEFLFDNNVTVYYLPGTTGWDTFFADGKTALWNPQAQSRGPDFGVRTNRFGFVITGTTNIPIVIEACTNPAGGNWTPLQNCERLRNGLVYFTRPGMDRIIRRVFIAFALP